MHSLRLGDEVGKHSVFFAALGERLELTHNATNRDTFVHGALRAAKWLANQRAGRYTVANVLASERGASPPILEARDHRKRNFTVSTAGCTPWSARSSR